MRPALLFLALLLLAPEPAWAADFSAAIGSDHVKSGDSVSLQLTLSGANARSAPDISALTPVFTITSRLQPSNITIGTTAASTTVYWQLSLLPKKEGRLTIAPITIQTDAGTLRTAPLVLDVGQTSTPKPSQVSIDGSTVSIIALAATMAPYQNQSIRYTVRSVLRGAVSDASLSEISVNNAIVTREGEPEVRDEIENGAPVKVIEFRFIITPLQPGKIVIPPAVMEGKVRPPDITGMFGGAGTGGSSNFLSAFGDDPFKVASNAVQLDVMKPATAMDPWLPLTSLRILEDTTVSQSVQPGQPLVRKITLLADGAVGDQLPDLEARQDHRNFRVYADKPETGEDVDAKSGTILGWRKESYTLIPQKVGRLVLPAIKVRWWDTSNNKAAIAELPERVINVLPAVAGPDAIPRSAPMRSSRRAGLLSDFGPLFLYALLGVLAAILAFVAFRSAKLWQRKTHPKMESPEEGALVTRQGIKPARKFTGGGKINQIRTVEELRSFLQTYLYMHRGASKNASLDSSLLALSKSWAVKEREDVDVVIKGIGAALYAGKTVDLDDLKRRCRRIIAALKRESKNSQNDKQRLRSLNPT